jgi:pimeloyl-ACP methyl ester carboxylesterase
MKWLVAIAVVLAVLAAVFVLYYLPLPEATARTAAGEQHIATRDSRTIAYFVRGEGPRIVLLASAGREASDFNELTQALSEAGYRTLAIDAPGIGASEIPGSDMTLWDLADDVRAVIAADSPAGEPAVVIGHAFGNRVARAFATRYPALTRKVIVLAAGGKRPVPEKAAESLRNAFNPLRSYAQREEDVRYAFFADGNPVPDYWRRGWHWRTAMVQGHATQSVNSAEWWLAGSAPLLVVQPDADRIAPKEDTADLLEAELKGRVRVVIIANAGHALLPEQPAAVSHAVLDYLSSEGDAGLSQAP